MKHQVFNAMQGFLVKKVYGILGGRQVTIHAVRDKTLGIVHMSGSFPGVVGELNFVAQYAKLGGGGTNHCIIGHTENREGDENTDTNE